MLVMYPDRESVERLEQDREQDQALLASRRRQDPEHLAAEETAEPDAQESSAREEEG